MEHINFVTGLEDELKIAKRMKETGKSRDEVIADAVSRFLCSMGFENPVAP